MSVAAELAYSDPHVLEGKDGSRRRLRQGAELGFALPQLCLCPLALDDLSLQLLIGSHQLGRALLHQLLKLIAVSPQFLLRLLAVGDVADQPTQARQLARRVAHGGNGDGSMNRRAIFRLQTNFPRLNSFLVPQLCQSGPKGPAISVGHKGSQRLVHDKVLPHPEQRRGGTVGFLDNPGRGW